MAFKYGLKLWSHNVEYIKDALSLFEKGLYHYIELYAVPGTFHELSRYWKELKIPYVIHAPHIKHGMNLSIKECEANNLKLTGEVLLFADVLKAPLIVMHPGITGTYGEVVRQLNIINDSRIVIENMPYTGKNDYIFCVGSRVAEIEEIVSNAGAGFCCDISHAVYAANALKIDPFEMIENFLSIKPKMLHLSDGSFSGTIDEHKNLGAGSFPLKRILKYLNENSMITLETKKSYSDSLKDFEEDLFYLQ